MYFKKHGYTVIFANKNRTTGKENSTRNSSDKFINERKIRRKLKTFSGIEASPFLSTRGRWNAGMFYTLARIEVSMNTEGTFKEKQFHLTKINMHLATCLFLSAENVFLESVNIYSVFLSQITKYFHDQVSTSITTYLYYIFSKSRTDTNLL